MRVFAWPRSPRKMMSWPASTAFSSWGRTVSSKPITDGMSCSPAAMRRTALRRISFLTGTERQPDARSSPKVVGRGESDIISRSCRFAAGRSGHARSLALRDARSWPPTYRRAGAQRSAGSAEAPQRRRERDRVVPVERRLEAVRDLAVGPDQRVARQPGAVVDDVAVGVGEHDLVR